MASQIKGSIGSWDQINADWQVPNYFLILKFTLKPTVTERQTEDKQKKETQNKINRKK